jgi:hypothetical protein
MEIDVTDKMKFQKKLITKTMRIVETNYMEMVELIGSKYSIEKFYRSMNIPYKSEGQNMNLEQSSTLLQTLELQE